EPHRGADHYLLGNEILEETIAVLLLELFAEGRVLHVSVERHNPLVTVTELGQRGTVRFARRHAIADLVRGRPDCALARRTQRPAAVATRARPVGKRRRFVLGHELRFELFQDLIELLAFLERLAVPAALPFGNGDAFALEGAGQNHRRLPSHATRLFERIEDFRQVVPIDDDRVPAEGTPLHGVRLHVVVPDRWTALPQTVDVGDAAQRIETVVR